MATTAPIPNSREAIPALAEARPMHAMVQSGYGCTAVLSLTKLPRPSPGPGEVLVKVHAAGLDRGTWHLMTGRPYLMRLMGFGFFGPRQPVPGLDVAGTVVAVGPGVTRFAIGDRVFGIARGSFAELSCAHQDKLARAPERLSLNEAAVLGVSALAALQALELGKVQPRERVLVVGASGGVGTFAVQLARAFGAEVTGVCRGEKLGSVRSLGARALDYQTEDFADGSIRYDLVLDVGGNTTLRRLRRALTERGRLVFVGNEHGGDYTAGFGRVLCALALGIFVKQRFAPLVAKEYFQGLERIAALADAGKLRPVIDRLTPLSEVPAALCDLEAGRVCGKVVVTVGQQARRARP